MQTQNVMNKNVNKKESAGKETSVCINFPDEIFIELVQANGLRNYEIFQWLVSLVSSIAVGFWTFYFEVKNRTALWSAIIFSLIAVFFIFQALYFRKKVFCKSIPKTLKISEFK